MAKTNRTKERRDQLASNIRRSQNQDARDIKELLGLMIDEAKDILVNSLIGPDDMFRCQGAVQSLVKLHHLLTVEPPSIAKEGDKQ